jgi:hypothetical protein
VSATARRVTPGSDDSVMHALGNVRQP